MEPNIERQLYKDIKTDCYYSVCNIIEDYVQIGEISRFVLFSAECSNLKIFEYLIKKSQEINMIFDHYDLLHCTVKNKNLDVFLYLIVNGEKLFKTDFFRNNSFCFLERNGKSKYFPKLIKVLKENDIYDKVVESIENEKLLKLLKITNKIENF